MPADPSPVARSVEQLRRQFGLAPDDELERVRQRWPEVVGAAQAATSTPVALREGVLRVETSDPAVLEALRWAEDRIVTALATGASPVRIEAVRGTLARRPSG